MVHLWNLITYRVLDTWNNFTLWVIGEEADDDEQYQPQPDSTESDEVSYRKRIDQVSENLLNQEEFEEVSYPDPEDESNSESEAGALKAKALKKQEAELVGPCKKVEQADLVGPCKKSE